MLKCNFTLRIVVALSLLFFAYSSHAQRIALLGDASSVANLPAAEQHAYNWAISEFGSNATYISFGDIATNGLPANIQVAWFHFEDDPMLPASAVGAAPAIEAMLNAGGGLVVSGFATEYALAVNATSVAPNETIDKDPAGPDVAWGIRPFPQFEDHPFFADIPPTTNWVDPNWRGFRTIADTTAGREAMRWWTMNTYPGTGMAAMPWFGGFDIPVVGTMDKGAGTVVTITAPGYNWVNAPSNGAGPQANLEQFTGNVLESLLPIPHILLLGDATDVASLPEGERNAYEWAQREFGFEAAYASFGDVALGDYPESIEQMWFHFEDDPALPTSAASAAFEIGAFVEFGGGLFLSSFATSYAIDIDATEVAPNETIDRDPAGPDAAWGIQPLAGQEMHPIFDGIATTTWPDPNWGGFQTIADTTAGREAIRWWTAGTYPGTALGTMPWRSNMDDIAGVGEIKYGLGKVITTSLPGYQWLPANRNGAPAQMNLEQYTENVLNYISPEASLILIGGSNSVEEMTEGERNAYEFALDVYGFNAAYHSFADIKANGLPSNTLVVWFHQEDSANFAADLDSIAGDIEAFVTDGGGALFSGFGTGYVVNTNLTMTAPNETIDNDPAGPDAAWGVRPLARKEHHPIFDGLPSTTWPDPNWGGFQTVSDSVAGREAIRWWTQGTYPGVALGTMPWRSPSDDIAAIGEISAGSGAVITASCPGYHWLPANRNGFTEQENLELFTENMIDYLYELSIPQEFFMINSANASDTIDERSVDGAVIDFFLENTIFNDTLNPANWKFINLPGNVTASVDRQSRDYAEINLTGMPDDFDMDILDFTVTVQAAEFCNLRTDSLHSVGEIVFKAFEELNISDDLNNKLSVKSFPNPFKGKVTFEFELPQASYTHIQILDVQGKIVAQLPAQFIQAGLTTQTLNLHALSKGIYFYQIHVNNEVMARGTMIAK